MSTAVTVHPIRTVADHRAALTRIEELWGARRGTPEGDELDVLLDLVHAFEERRYEMPWGKAHDIVRHLMEANGLTQGDLPEIGPQSAVSAILAGKRQLNLRMIKALAKRFHLPADAFID
ncbi:MAG: helix-turn-helix domain-containing protein [Planctomycetes bacterium]|nr:helix-turn-helix domain-containing protein [Planctomycetota bacterium]